MAKHICGLAERYLDVCRRARHEVNSDQRLHSVLPCCGCEQRHVVHLVESKAIGAFKAFNACHGGRHLDARLGSNVPERESAKPDA